MKPTLTAFKDSPDQGQGMARDMRVRWALEEVGQGYEVQLVTFEEMEEPAYLALQPFGQIPAYREGDLVLFETGAILLHLANHHAGLLPTNAKERARAISWMFAALNTVEPPIVDLEVADLLETDKPWYEKRLPFLKGRIHEVLGDLARHLGDAEWLTPEFSAADILMVTVLRRAEGTGTLEEFPTLLAYIARGLARPAYLRAFADQLAIFQNRGKGGSLK
jgi:glutathione S-transferase